ncbi:Exodeoxyribonuclease 8 [compost metagenome]
MTVELKVFGGAYLPKDKALKKSPELKPLAISVNALNKNIAEAVIFGKLATAHPQHIEDYFKVKIWEDREGLPRPTLDVFCADFFGSVATWNAETGEPAAVQPEGDEREGWDGNAEQEEMKTVSQLDQHSRAACLALFGSVAKITGVQYGQVIDLLNDDVSSFARELMEAIAKETRALALAPERQEQLLSWVRAEAKETAQWPDIKKLIAKWIDTPADKREKTNESSNDKDGQDSKTLLRYNIARGIIARSMDFNISSTPLGIEQRANAMLSDKNEARIDGWFLMLSRTPGIYDFHPAVIIAMIKASDEKIQNFPGEIRKFIDKTIQALDCSNPDPLIIDIACGRTSSPMPQISAEEPNNAETQSNVPCETLPGTGSPKSDAEFNAEIESAMAASEALQRSDTQSNIENHIGNACSANALMGEQSSNEVKEDNRPVLKKREIEIAHAINDLLSGRTGIMGMVEADGVVRCTDHLISTVIPLLMADIITAECCLSPNFSDEEIHYISTTVLDAWSDVSYERQEIAVDTIVEYRKPAPPKKIIPETVAEPALSVAPASEAAPLTYRQQLTIAALQGMCANPAYRGDFEDLPHMALELVDVVINLEGA